MIFKIGLFLTVFVTIPVFIIGASMCLITDKDADDPDEEPEVCGNCNHCILDFGVWTCLNEESLWYEKAVDLGEEGCSEWESDSK